MNRLAKVITVSASGETVEVEFQDGTFVQAVDEFATFTTRNETAWAGCLGELPTVNQFIRVWHWRDRWWYNGAEPAA